MIKLVPSADNILRVFLRADAADVSEGIDWYPQAYAHAERLGRDSGHSVEVAAGVIAALSPLNEWEKNLRDAERVLFGDFSGCLTRGLEKSRLIMSGADIAETLNAPKTRNFWQSIVTCGAEGVCIDRHAYDIAVGYRSADKARSIKGALYEACAEAYREASRRLDDMGVPVSPAEVQSVTWEEHRREWKDVRVTSLVPLFAAA